MHGGFQELLEELFIPVGGVTFRRMFGGIGIFKEGIMFALVADEVLKTDEATRARYEAEGSGPFVYDGTRGKTTAMPYWRLPERLFDEPEEFRDWAVASFAVAERAKKKKPKAAAGRKTAGGLRRTTTLKRRPKR